MHQNQPGITVKKTICDICCPSFHCGMDCHVRDGKIIKVCLLYTSVAATVMDYYFNSQDLVQETEVENKMTED